MDALERRRYLLWLSFAIGSDHKKYHALLSDCQGDPYEVFKAAQQGSLARLNSVPAKAASIKKFATETFIDKCLARLNSLNINIASFEDDEYPYLLKQIEQPPSALYYRGILKGDMPLPIALIGSRTPSDYAMRATYTMAKDLAEQGVTIISGMAYGLDGQAALGALSAKNNDYPTIAVLGSGVDVVYPASNRRIYNKIIDQGCAVVSEFMPGSEPERHNFVQRNRVISGMAKGVIVAEAKQKSGTFITVDFALDQGKDIFVMPGRIYDTKCIGSNALIRDGNGAMVLSADDVLFEYGLSTAQRSAERVLPLVLPPEQAKIYSLLVNGEKSFDELCTLCEVCAQELNSTLTDMELSGIIKQSSGRVYYV